MPTVAPAREMASNDLWKLIRQLPSGDTITLTDTNGLPLAVVVSVSPPPIQPPPMPDWHTRWKSLALRIGQTWKTEQSALETLAEMRR